MISPGRARDVRRVIAVLLLAMLFPAVGISAQTPGVLRLAVLSDPHVSEEAKNADYLARYRESIRQVNEEKVDVVLIAGDLSESGKEKQLQDARPWRPS